MGFLVIHYKQNLKKKLNIVWYTNTFNTKLFSKKKNPTAEKMTKKRTSTSHDLQFHQERKNQKKKIKTSW